jgi:hypothetical protein
MRTSTCGRATVARNLETTKRMVREWKAIAPRTRVGFYGFMPLQGWWPIVHNHPPGAWERTRIDNAAFTDLARMVDFITVDLYTFYEGQNANWVTYAQRSIQEARRYRKPVLPFVWFAYTRGGNVEGYVELDRAFWRLQLETLNRISNGIIIWGGWQRTWNPRAPWWLETQAFIRRVR